MFEGIDKVLEEAVHKVVHKAVRHTTPAENTELQIKENWTITGEDVLESLLIRGQIAEGDLECTDTEIYKALNKCKELIDFPSLYLESREYLQEAFSERQICCAMGAIELIMSGRYYSALHEFEDCIDDYGKGRRRFLSKDELVLYNCILICFILKMESQSGNTKELMSNMTTQESMGLRIKELRESNKLSQSELATLVGYKDKTAIAKVEAGKVDLPQSKISAFAKALNTTTSYLFSDTQDTICSDASVFPPDVRGAARGMMDLSESDKELVINMIKSLSEKERRIS